MERPRTNVELKARDRDPARSLDCCRDLGAEDRGTLRQRDTYFSVPDGRLKLREEDGGEPHLIAYRRPDRSGARKSEYFIVAVADAEATRAALASVLGVRAEVRKRRRLFLHGRVRIHLDEVDGLGSFVELEGVVSPESNSAAERSEVERLRTALRIDDGDLVAGGYLNLVEGA